MAWQSSAFVFVSDSSRRINSVFGPMPQVMSRRILELVFSKVVSNRKGIKIMLSKGEKIFVVTRRLFESDLRRHFVGKVQQVSGAAVRVRGYAFVFDATANVFVRRNELRTRIFSLIDAGYTMTVLPGETILDKIQYSLNEKGQRVLTDDSTFTMNVSEFGVHH